MRRLLGGILAAGCLVAAGCSFTLDLGDECTTASDCADGLACVSNLCVADDGSGGNAGAGGEAGMGGAGGGGGMAPRPEFCTNVYGTDEATAFGEDVIRIGMLMPTTGDLGPVGLAIEQAAALAAEEINDAGGLDGTPFAIIACDTATNSDQAQAMALWLIDSMGVPAIIGPATSTNTLAVFNNISREKGVLQISPSATSPAISDLVDEDRMWRTVPSDAIQGQAIVAYIGAQAYDKVAVVHLDDAYGRGLLNAIQFPLCDADRCGEDFFFSRPYTADDDGNVDLDQVTSILTDLQTFEPDVLVFAGFVEAGSRILNNAALAAGFDQIPIVLTDGMRNTKVIENVNNQDLLRNVIGTAPASPEGAVFGAFSNGYRGKWGADPGVYNAQAYDAMYLVALGIAGIVDEPITGAAIAANLQQMSSGEPVSARADEWNKGVRLLRDGSGFDFSGASGALDFDNARGEAPADIEGWYFDVDAMSVESLGVIFTADGEYRAPQLPEPMGME